MQDLILEFVRETLLRHVILINFAAVGIVGAMAIDLVTGIRKARINGKARTSRGLKMTAKKAAKYLTPFATLSFIDLLAAVVVPFPPLSMIWAAYCIYCEFVSVRENAWEKSEIERAGKTMHLIVDNKDDIARMVVEMLTRQKPADDEDK
ncbi:MAG: phage holin family protein [Bacteroidaceae bacterium]|nr:phage holin family protein [Bacteroidaceae bacterium]